MPLGDVCSSLANGRGGDANSGILNLQGCEEPIHFKPQGCGDEEGLYMPHCHLRTGTASGAGNAFNTFYFYTNPTEGLCFLEEMFCGEVLLGGSLSLRAGHLEPADCKSVEEVQGVLHKC